MGITLTLSRGNTRLTYDQGFIYHKEIIVNHIVSFEKYNSTQIILNLSVGPNHLTFDNTTDRDKAYDLLETLFP